MPRPLSSTYGSTELNMGDIPREVILQRLTPQALLQQGKSILTDNWRNALPKGTMGEPLDYQGDVGNLLNTLRSGQINASDDTGSINVGPGGIYLSNRTYSPEAIQKESDIWNLEINPLARAASFSKGDFGVGGTFGADKSGYIRKGPVRLDAGYGPAPVYTPSADVAPPGSYQITPGGNEPWAKLSVELGEKFPMMESDPETAAKYAVERAVQRDLPAQGQQQGTNQSGREYAEQFLKDYIDQNENWWRQ